MKFVVQEKEVRQRIRKGGWNKEEAIPVQFHLDVIQSPPADFVCIAGNFIRPELLKIL
ncbi:hypothetical protein [Microcoleus sp. F4-D5]|uniref:hypothetical protein n=1 Tax=Microcoleus sp. F4-D5 TaxID=2818760 RepID=UPI002FD05451